MFVCWLGFSPKQALDKEITCRMFSPVFVHKLLLNEEHSDIWKPMSKEGLLFPRISNKIVINTPGVNPFWQRLQKNTNGF